VPADSSKRSNSNESKSSSFKALEAATAPLCNTHAFTTQAVIAAAEQQQLAPGVVVHLVSS
jgi:hypothetical protein